MKVTVDYQEFFTNLKSLSRVAGSQRYLIMPVLITVDDNCMRLTTTDLLHIMTCMLDCVSDQSGELTVHVKTLLTVLNAPKNELVGTLTLETLDVGIRLIMAQRSTTIACEDPDKFPTTHYITSNPDCSGWQKIIDNWDLSPFAESLKYASLAMGSDPTRMCIYGVCIEDQKLIATDGARIHIANTEASIMINMDQWAQHAKAKLSNIIVNAEAVKLLLTMCTSRKGEPARKLNAWYYLDAKSIGQDDKGDPIYSYTHRVRFSAGNGIVLYTQLSDVAFVPYQHVIPRDKDMNTQFEVDPTVLAKLATHLAKIDECGSWYINGDDISLESINPDTGSSRVVIDARNKQINFDSLVQADQPRIAMNLNFLANALHGKMRSQISMRLNNKAESLDPILISNHKGMIAIVMPRRIN